MSQSDQFDRNASSEHRATSSQNQPTHSDVSASSGVPIRCQYCSHQNFRRSSLRATDLTQILLMRYPVRCMRCGQRQMVSFTVAGLSLPPSSKPHKSFETPASKHWTEPHSDRGPNDPRRSGP
jgi:DNA-directed RNA polymerase subunit RPC12/RpoP